ncbi:PRD domain-containing protein [Virgibacillus halophilus]|uniref:PRD domain-containing protein n=1 Tax=Tigheibacillus halophilus TaxID=361280 RepID=A0ABU5CB88_9BACI|nr:PRD domain-containing protein [Virgibacillus halophilus]
MADSSYVGLVVHIALALERLHKGDSITFDRSYLSQLKSTLEYRIAGKMIQELEKEFHIHIPEDEIGYITMHLLGAKLRAGEDFLLEDTSLDTAYRAKELISFVSNELNLDLSANNSLLTDLVAHLKPAVFRIAQGMKIKNPLMNEIKTDYEELFEVILAGTREAFSGMDFPDEEIAYLVLHFASAILHVESSHGLKALVLCSSGIGSAKMLASRLKQHIPEIQEVVNQSVFEMGDIDKNSYDLIVSTIPLRELEEDEYILVSPMLNKQEEHKVKKAVRKQLISKPTARKVLNNNSEENTHFQELQGLQQYMHVFIDLLHAFSVSKVDKQQDIPSVLQQICLNLERKGNITNKTAVLEKLLQREKIGGLGIPGSTLALFHTRSDDILTAVFQIYDLEEALHLRGDGWKSNGSKAFINHACPARSG